MVIVGGGVIGTELACYFADSGRKVTVLEYAERVLPFFSKELSTQLSSALKRKGVDIFTSARVTEVGKGHAVFERGGAEGRAEGVAVIAATGRRARVEGIGLHLAGLPETPVQVDDNMMTTTAGVYAAGDVTGGIQLAHYAAACALKAVGHMAGAPVDIDLATVPSLVYTSPELFTVGHADEGARTGKFLLGANGKNLVNGSNRGFIKVYCDDKGVITAAEGFGDGGHGACGRALSRRQPRHDCGGHCVRHTRASDALRERRRGVRGRVRAGDPQALGGKMAKRTALFDTHVALGGKMVEFAGYDLPVQYSGILEEHRAVREAAGVFDVSHMGEFFFEGEGAEEELNAILTNDIRGMTDGRVRYSLLPDEKGCAVDDVLIYRFAATKFMMDSEIARKRTRRTLRRTCRAASFRTCRTKCRRSRCKVPRRFR